MKNYKGYYIDGVIFHNEKEVDEFRKNQAVEAYKTAIRMFEEHSDMEHSIFADEKAEILHNQFGLDWNEIEAIEISVYNEAA